MLHQLGSHGETLTHATVDLCAAGQTRHAARALLIQAGFLPTRDEHLDRLETWVDDFTTQLPPHHAAIIAPFGQWHVLRSLRRRTRGKAATIGATNYARQQLRDASLLLAYAERRGSHPFALTQEVLDTWTGGDRFRTRTIAPFIRWLNRRDPNQLLLTANAAPPPPSESSSEDDHHRLIRELIAFDTPTSLPIRVAGLLVLLLGARIERIHRLTTDDITTTRGHVHLALATAPVRLPEQIGVLVQQLAAQARATPHSAIPTNSAHYLFPSPRRRQQPLHPHTLGRHLRAAGIPNRLGRNQALLALASDLPAAVIATQLGLRPQTTIRWARLSQRDNAHYLRARSTSSR